MWLNFSDAAKYADIARNLLLGKGFGINFTFFWPKVFESLSGAPFPAFDYLPFMPLSMYAFFRLFGATDQAIIATSIFYFVLTLFFVYLFAKRLFNSKLTGVLSTIGVGLNYDLIHYAVSGASESPFIFEIVAASYFVSLKKRWSNFVGLLVLVLMYFTRPQAFIYIAGIILYLFFINFKPGRALVYFGITLFCAFLVDYLILRPLSGNLFIYSVTYRWLTSSFNQTSSAAESLRGLSAANGEIVQLLKNIFYNLYNFYKLLPQIINPYFFTLFVVGLFVKGNEAFKTATVFTIIVNSIVTAASIPFFRYLHPVVPFVYIIAVGTLVEITKTQIANYKQITIFKLQITKSTLFALATFWLVFFFGAGQTIGIFILDSRFEKSTHNFGKPPVYYKLAEILKENTTPSQTIITNLDSWGSWYGERKTIWFPLNPKQIIDPATGNIPFDAIYLTSYLIDDQNYYMGEDWRQIFNNPRDPKKWSCEGCGEIAKEYTLKNIYTIEAGDDYNKVGARAVLLTKY